MQLLQRIQTLKVMLQKEKPSIKSQGGGGGGGVKTFEQNGDVYIFLILPKYLNFFY